MPESSFPSVMSYLTGEVIDLTTQPEPNSPKSEIRHFIEAAVKLADPMQVEGEQLPVSTSS